MSWFVYGTPERRSWRKGVALRVRDLPLQIVQQAKKLMHTLEAIDYVIVEELRPEKRILLAVHVRAPGAFANARGHREGVIRFIVDENPEWICEGDIGRGCVEDKRQ